MTTARRLAGRLASGLLVVVALAVGAVFLVPKALGLDVYVITTGSMAGTVDPGGIVVAERVPVADLAVGDVITYMPPPTSGVDHLVTHRIAEIGTDAAGLASYRTKGDANAGVDPWTFTLETAQQARMVTSLPLLGHPVLWLADRETRMLAIGAPAALIALLSLVDLVRGLRPARPVEEPVVLDLTEPVTPAVPALGTLAAA